ncbi:MAG: PLP-dependent transferase [Pyrinomonadaceae bacterium]
MFLSKIIARMRSAKSRLASRIPDQLRDRLAPPPDLIRLSVGIEDVDDIIEDLERPQFLLH